MTEFLSRSAWTDTAPQSNGRYGHVTGISVHYPAAGAPIGPESAARIAARLRSYRSYHINVRGWGDIGYNFAIDQAGRVWELRGMENVGAHSASKSNPRANTTLVGVLFVVGNDEPISEAAVLAFRELRGRVLARFPSATGVTGHGQVPGAQTACPGPQLRALIASGALTGGAVPTPGPTPAPKPAPTTGGVNVAALPVLRKGSKGLPVKRLQGLLIANGYSVGAAGIDGSFGPATDRGFRAFQANHPETGTNGKPDGSCGPKSWSKLLGV